MNDTPATLLHRLCINPAAADWERFVRLFTPLMQRWAKRLGVIGNEADDLLQECFMILIRKLPEFEYDPQRRFRAWLWTVFRHSALAWRKRNPRAGAGLAQLEQLASPDSLAEATEAEYRGYLVERIMQLVQSDFPEPTWRIFRQVAIEERPAGEVAVEFGVSVNAVYLARSRVLARLRQDSRSWRRSICAAPRCPPLEWRSWKKPCPSAKSSGTKKEDNGVPAWNREKTIQWR